MRAGGGSAADRETSVGAVDEHHRGIPAEPLRPYVAAYTGYRQRGAPPAKLRRLRERRPPPAKPPRPAVALPDADLHPGRAAHDRGASRPRAAARRVRRT